MPKQTDRIILTRLANLKKSNTFLTRPPASNDDGTIDRGGNEHSSRARGAVSLRVQLVQLLESKQINHSASKGTFLVLL